MSAQVQWDIGQGRQVTNFEFGHSVADPIRDQAPGLTLDDLDGLLRDAYVRAYREGQRVGREEGRRTGRDECDRETREGHKKFLDWFRVNVIRDVEAVDEALDLLALNPGRMSKSQEESIRACAARLNRTILTWDKRTRDDR
jgi:hypothetical protein